MKTWTSAAVTSTVLLFMCTGGAESQLAAQQSPEIVSTQHRVRYRLVDLGTFGGPDSAETVEFPFINNRGTVVGFADTDTPDPNAPNCITPQCLIAHAFRWKLGRLADLGALPGGDNSFAIWSNNLDLVVGQSQNGQIDPILGVPVARATLWERNGHPTDLGTLGGTQGLAGSINDRGQVVGAASDAISDPFSIFGWGTRTRAFLWQDGTMQDLGTLGGSDALAVFINQRGQIAGDSYTGSHPTDSCLLFNSLPVQVATGAFLWDRGKMLELGSLGGTCTWVVTINNRGEIVGQSNLAGNQMAHPFLWRNGRIQDLGTLGGTFGTATWMNDAGDVAGGATTNDQQLHAFFWSRGVMTDLGTIKDDTCSVAHYINAQGLVVGTSGDCSGVFEVHGFLWQRGGSMMT